MLEEHLTACRANLVRELEHPDNSAVGGEPQVLRDDPVDDHFN